MSAQFLWLLSLGLCLGSEDQGQNETLPRPSLRARPSSVVELGSSVTLQCQAGSQNVTFMLGKLRDSGYKQEQSSSGSKAEFLLSSLQPEDAGGYFCAYKTAAAQEWSERSQRLQLVVTGSLPEPSLSVSVDPEAAPGHRTLQCLIPHNTPGCIITILLKAGIAEPLQVKKGKENQSDFPLWNVTSKDWGSYSCVYYQCDWPHLGSSRSHSLEMWGTGEDPDEQEGPGAAPTKTDPRMVFAATFSCLCIALLFLSVFLVDRCTWQSSSGEDSSRRSSHSEFPKQQTPDSSKLEKTPVQTVTFTELSTEEASVPAEAATGPHEGAALAV